MKCLNLNGKTRSNKYFLKLAELMYDNLSQLFFTFRIKISKL